MSQTEQQLERERKDHDVKVRVTYLPATHPFRQEFPRTATVEEVRTAAMLHFGVSDRQERDTYRYYLEFDGERINDTSRTLADLLGRERQAHFNLIEEITPGSAA